MSIVAAPPLSPFKGLAAFGDSELDAQLFFGRERERKLVVANLFASRLTVLYGESGVGKSSLLAAGVLRDLREAAPGAPAVYRSTWSGELGDVRADFGDGEGFLILDQFEEYFLYHEDDGSGPMLQQLVDLLDSTDVNIVIALREDSLARLSGFKARIPQIFGNQFRLKHLDVEQARLAVLGPLRRWEQLTGEHVDAEPALVEAVVDDVAADGGRVEAPYLQLVLERVWEAERAARSWLLRRRTLDALGGAAAIVRDQFRGALEALSPEEQDTAAAIFEHLVTPTGTKIALRADDLSAYAHVSRGELDRVLDRLARDRILHAVDESDRYEIFHDVLAEPIIAWRAERRLARERAAAQRRQRRLLAVAGAALAALVVVAGLAAWALSERGHARAQAQHARARALDATALQLLSVDASRGVRLALNAVRLDRGAGTDTVLRDSLIADRLRLVRHTPSPVRAVAASPRGDLIAAALAGSGGVVLLLDAHNRRLVRTIATGQRVAAVSFTADGRAIVTATPRALAATWRTSDGRRLSTRGRAVAARAPDGSLRLVRLTRRRLERVSTTAGGDRIAATQGGRPVLFDSRGRLVRMLPQREVEAVAFSPNGRLLVSAGRNGFVDVWRARTGAFVRSLRAARSGAAAVAFSPDSRLVAAGGGDGAVRIWDVGSGERKGFLSGQTNPVQSLVWSPDGSVIASGSTDGSVLLWRLQGLVGAGSLVATLAGDGSVGAPAFSSDSRLLLTGGEGRTLRIWDARPDQQLHVIAHGRGPALGADWAGKTVVAFWPHEVRTFGARERLLGTTLRTRLTALAVGGGIAAAGAADGTTRVWSLRSGVPLAVTRSRAPVVSVAVSEDGRLVASGDRAGRVRLRDARGAVEWTTRQVGPVADLAFSRAGTELAGAGRRGLTLWSTADGRRLNLLESPAGDSRVAFSPDGRFVASAGLDANGRIWFAKTGSLYRRLHGHRKPLTGIVFSNDGRIVATSSSDADARIWNVEKGTNITLQRTSFGPLADVALDPTGQWVAAAAPTTVILWAESSGRQLFRLRGHTEAVTSVAFAPVGKKLLTASRDGTVRTYGCEVCGDRAALIHLAEVRIARTR